MGSSFCHVGASIWPVIGRPLAYWKFVTACWVPAPKRPLTTPSSPTFIRCCCAHTTRSERLPRRSSGSVSRRGGRPNGSNGEPSAFHWRLPEYCHTHHEMPLAP